MKEKINYDNLYVAFPVFKREVEKEPWIQYESFGKVEHTVIVSPKRVLIGSKTDEFGDTKYYDYKTGKEVVEKSYDSSFTTTSSPIMSVYSSYAPGQCMIGEGYLKELFDLCLKNPTNRVGYLTPFSEFAEEKFGLSLDDYSPSLASKLVTLANLTSRRKGIALSHDKDVAKKQLEELGYHTDSEKTYSKK